jgi:hypothetical protein
MTKLKPERNYRSYVISIDDEVRLLDAALHDGSAFVLLSRQLAPDTHTFLIGLTILILDCSLCHLLLLVSQRMSISVTTL